MTTSNKLTTLLTAVLQMVTVKAEIEDANEPGDQAASSSKPQPGWEPQPALGKR